MTTGTRPWNQSAGRRIAPTAGRIARILHRRPRIALVTTCALARLPMARVVASSARRWNGALRCIAVVADEPAEDLQDDAALELVWAREIGVPDLRAHGFALEREPLTYAITPHAVAHVLAMPGVDAVIFIKQESLVTGSLAPVVRALASAPIVVTPHHLGPLEGDDAAERELVVSGAGIFNAGVLGVRDDRAGRDFAAWWAARTLPSCVLDVAAGLHYEQRWLDLVPSLFADATVLRDERVNIGHWNMRERRLSLQGDHVLVNGEQASVVRLSGYEPERPAVATKYGARPRMDELHGARAVFDLYARELGKAGHEAAQHERYAYGSFSDGVQIPPLARELFRVHRSDVAFAADPFAVGPGSVRAWLAEPVAAGVTRFWDEAWRRRLDLRQAFPGHLGADAASFLAWTVAHGRAEYGVQDAF